MYRLTIKDLESQGDFARAYLLARTLVHLGFTEAFVGESSLHPIIFIDSWLIDLTYDDEPRFISAGFMPEPVTIPDTLPQHDLDAMAQLISGGF